MFYFFIDVLSKEFYYSFLIKKEENKKDIVYRERISLKPILTLWETILSKKYSKPDSFYNGRNEGLMGGNVI